MQVVATAGHVDHGKSTLVKALTGTDPDRLAEEKERGLTIDLGFASADLPSSAAAWSADPPSSGASWSDAASSGASASASASDDPASAAGSVTPASSSTRSTRVALRARDGALTPSATTMVCSSSRSLPSRADRSSA